MTEDVSAIVTVMVMAFSFFIFLCCFMRSFIRLRIEEMKYLRESRTHCRVTKIDETGTQGELWIE